MDERVNVVVLGNLRERELEVLGNHQHLRAHRERLEARGDVGLAARGGRDLPGITGKVGDIKKGSIRDGGSFAKRIGHYSSWNSYFTNNAYQIKRWNDFLSA